MKSFPSSSCSDSLYSSSYSLASTSLRNRLDTIFKKASELSILCEVEVCVIYYGPDGELKTWPEEREKVKDMASRYTQLHETLRSKKRLDLGGFLNKKQNKGAKHMKKKKKKTMSLGEKVKYPIADHYSPNQISRMISSLELSYSALQVRLRFVESQKHKETKLGHQDHIPFSLNHQDYTVLQAVQESVSNYDLNQLMYNQNMCMSGFTNNNILDPCLSSNVSDVLCSDFQDSYYPNMCMSGFTNNNVLDPCLSSIVSDVLCSEYQDPYGNMIGNHSFSQDFSNMPSSYESSLLQTSTLDTIPNSYFIPDNSRFLFEQFANTS